MNPVFMTFLISDLFQQEACSNIPGLLQSSTSLKELNINTYEYKNAPGSAFACFDVSAESP